MAAPSQVRPHAREALRDQLVDTFRQQRLPGFPREEEPQGLMELFNEHQRFINQSFPGARASGNGQENFDRLVKMRERRLAQKVRLEFASSLLSLSWKVAWTVAGVGAAWHHFAP